MISIAAKAVRAVAKGASKAAGTASKQVASEGAAMAAQKVAAGAVSHVTAPPMAVYNDHKRQGGFRGAGGSPYGGLTMPPPNGGS